MAVWRLSFGGPLYQDVWQCNLHMVGSAPPVGAVMDAMLDAVTADVTKWYLAAGFTSNSLLSWVKLNEINPLTGAYVSQTDTHERVFAGQRGTGGAGAVPQLSLCVSLLTGQRRGAAARGRFYPPPLGGFGILTDGQVGSATREAVATGAQKLIRDLNNWQGIDLPGALDVCVLGKGGVTRTVTSVAVGSVIDTQRRRRNKLKEVYTERPI